MPPGLGQQGPRCVPPERGLCAWGGARPGRAPAGGLVLRRAGSAPPWQDSARRALLRVLGVPAAGVPGWPRRAWAGASRSQARKRERG